jgi:hypothetical protein
VAPRRPAPGVRVTIGGAFASLVKGPGTAPPYDFRKREWASSRLGGQWLLGFTPPPQVGRLKPLRVTVRADVSAPQQTITIRRGQAAGAQPHEYPSGEAVATWRLPIGPAEASFDCREGDYDGTGRVWLLLEVQNSTPAGSSGVVSPWKFHQLQLTYVAETLADAAEAGGIDEARPD